ELIDRYVEGSLSKTERERFENFFLCSPGRKEKLRFARTLHAYDEKSQAVVPAFTLSSFIRSYAGMAVFAMLLIGVALVVWRVFLFKSREQETLAALTQAYTSGRLFESRIS